MAIYNAVYATATEIKDNTQITELAAETDAVIDTYIVKAQFLIDGYIGPITPYDESQDFKFPNESNEVPKNVKQSTVYVVEALYREMLQQRNGIKSESWDGYSVSFATEISSVDFEYATKATQALLEQYGLGNGAKQAFSLNY